MDVQKEFSDVKKETQRLVLAMKNIFHMYVVCTYIAHIHVYIRMYVRHDHIGDALGSSVHVQRYICMYVRILTGRS